MTTVTVNKKLIGPNSPTYLIAEIGINHNGDIKNAFKLIELAAQTGFDAVKFQKRTVDLVYTQSELEKPRENFFGKTNGDLKRGLEFDLDAYKKIDSHCKALGIDWFASPWDVKSVDFLEELQVCAYKIASACLTNKELLKKIASIGKPVFLSTGMSTLEQVQRAVNILNKDNLVLMHAVSMYPAENSDLHLNWISELQEQFYPIPVGYSGHEVGVMPSVVAVSKFSAVCIERHITLDRSMWGSDQAASLEPDGMRRLVSYIRSLILLEKNQSKKVLEKEIPIMSKLRTIDDL